MDRARESESRHALHGAQTTSTRGREVSQSPDEEGQGHQRVDSLGLGKVEVLIGSVRFLSNLQL